LAKAKTQAGRGFRGTVSGLGFGIAAPELAPARLTPEGSRCHLLQDRRRAAMTVNELIRALGTMSGDLKVAVYSPRDGDGYFVPIVEVETRALRYFNNGQAERMVNLVLQ
jgi:hypothetical protein